MNHKVHDPARVTVTHPLPATIVGVTDDGTVAVHIDTWITVPADQVISDRDGDTPDAVINTGELPAADPNV